MPFMKLERPREFKIETYYYKPEEETDQKHKIHFRRIRHSKRVPKLNPVRLIFAILALIFVIYYLQKKATVLQEPSNPGKIQVEEIIIAD